MTETKEAEQTCKDKAASINNGPPAMKESETVEDNSREEKKEVDKENRIEENPKEDEKEVEEEMAEAEADDDNDDDEKAEDSEDEDDEQEKKSEHSLPNASNDGRKELHLEGSCEKSYVKDIDSSVDEVENGEDLQTVNVQSNVDDSGGSPDGQSSPTKVEYVKEDKVNDDVKMKECPTDAESGNPSNLLIFDTDTSGGGDSGTVEEQAAFIGELRKFHKDRSLDFKPPKFYGVPLNLLKLWRAVLRLGGYDKVTACKYWRQVGESFKPPKTCTTISFTFRIFYEKALLDYERYRTSGDGSLLASFSEPMGAENQAIPQAPGSGRARRDSAVRAMQGWHPQRILDNGEVSDPIVKDKNSVPLSKKEKPLSSLGGGHKRKKPISADDATKTPHTKLPKVHSDATVIDIGSPADWVKINVQATRDCYEVYALVPGLLREEVRVQSDPAGRLVISGEPENPDNPWDVTPFKKVVSLPSRIDPHQTSAVVTLHGQLFVRVPFE